MGLLRAFQTSSPKHVNTNHQHPQHKQLKQLKQLKQPRNIPQNQKTNPKNRCAGFLPSGQRQSVLIQGHWRLLPHPQGRQFHGAKLPVAVGFLVARWTGTGSWATGGRNRQAKRNRIGLPQHGRSCDCTPIRSAFPHLKDLQQTVAGRMSGQHLGLEPVWRRPTAAHWTPSAP